MKEINTEKYYEFTTRSNFQATRRNLRASQLN